VDAGLGGDHFFASADSPGNNTLPSGTSSNRKRSVGLKARKSRLYCPPPTVRKPDRRACHAGQPEIVHHAPWGSRLQGPVADQELPGRSHGWGTGTLRVHSSAISPSSRSARAPESLASENAVPPWRRCKRRTFHEIGFTNLRGNIPSTVCFQEWHRRELFDVIPASGAAGWKAGTNKPRERSARREPDSLKVKTRIKPQTNRAMAAGAIAAVPDYASPSDSLQCSFALKPHLARCDYPPICASREFPAHEVKSAYGAVRHCPNLTRSD